MNGKDKMVAVPKKDPLVAATRKARLAEHRRYVTTNQYSLDQLLAEETRWRRKATIAQNKLAWIRMRINDLADELAKALDGRGDK